MVWLGVRCWKDKIAFVAVDDTGPTPIVTFKRRQPVPSTSDPGERAGWFARTASEAITETACAGVSVRVADSDPNQVRAEAEGAVLATANEAGLPTITVRRQSLMRPLGIKNTAGAWKTFQKEDAFVGGLVGDEKDAAMASLAGARP